MNRPKRDSEPSAAPAKSEPGTDGDAGEGVVGNVAGHSRDLHQEIREVTQHCPAAGQNHPFVDDVG